MQLEILIYMVNYTRPVSIAILWGIRECLIIVQRFSGEFHRIEKIVKLQWTFTCGLKLEVLK